MGTSKGACGGTSHVPRRQEAHGTRRQKNKKEQPIKKLRLQSAIFLCAFSFASLACADVVFDSFSVLTANSVKKFDGMGQHGVSFRYSIIRENRPWWMPTSLDLGTGWVERDGDAAAFVSFGPTYRIHPGRSDKNRWFADIASHPTYLSRSDFGGKPLGGNFHFTSSLGVGAYLDRNRRTSLMLRYQHTSNAGLSESNPGVDMVALTFSYNFGQQQQLVSAADGKQE